MKTKLILGIVVFIFVGLVSVCGYIVGENAGSEAYSTGYEYGIIEATMDCEAKITNLEQQNNLLAETVEIYADVAAEFYDMVYGDKKDSSELPCRLYDSLVVIDGILYERAVGANTAHNNGVAVPFEGIEL